jgi:hypothetical protein
MKRVLYTIKIISVNIVLIDIFFITFNPFHKSLEFMIKHGIEWLFSPNPEMNILMLLFVVPSGKAILLSRGFERFYLPFSLFKNSSNSVILS